MKAPLEVIEAPDRDLIDRIADSLPEDLRAGYYREMIHCRSLPENDELLRVIRAMQFLTVLIHQAPERLANERAQLDANLAGCVSALGAIKKRLDSLPEAVSRGISPEKVAARVNESLRQQFFQTTIPQTAEALALASAELKRSVAGFVATMQDINNKYNGAASEARAAVNCIESSITSATRTSNEATEHLTRTLVRVHWTSFFMAGLCILLIGFLIGAQFRFR
jgi:hypothetical protein